MTDPPTALARASAAPIEGTRKSIFLHAGRVFAAREPWEVTTILGSCVSVCLFDPSTHIGGMNHFQLPHWAGDGEASSRFGNVATARLLALLIDLGADPRRLQARIFGGGCVIEAFRRLDRQHLGAQNVDVARAALYAERIAVVEEDVGGDRGRKLRFRTDDGTAWARPV